MLLYTNHELIMQNSEVIRSVEAYNRENVKKRWTVGHVSRSAWCIASFEIDYNDSRAFFFVLELTHLRFVKDAGKLYKLYRRSRPEFGDFGTVGLK